MIRSEPRPKAKADALFQLNTGSSAEPHTQRESSRFVRFFQALKSTMNFSRPDLLSRQQWGSRENSVHVELEAKLALDFTLS